MKNLKKSPNIGGTHADNPFQKVRLKAGISQEQAAEQLSCATRTLQRYEAGKTVPDYPMLCGMMDCYNCEAADFFPDLSLLGGDTGGDAQ